MPAERLSSIAAERVSTRCPFRRRTNLLRAFRSRTSSRRSTAAGIRSRPRSATVSRSPRRSSATGTTCSATYGVDVDRTVARFGAWYELFPRSWGGFDGVRKVLPGLAELGFDVVSLPPVHPIGHTNRKGRNNALEAARGDVGSPWAI